MPPAMRLHALRGAITVEENEREAILERDEELMGELLARNDLRPEDIVNCIFTMTDDLNAEFPAVAARAIGFDRVPLLCVREIDVPGSLPRVIRVLVQYHADDAHRRVTSTCARRKVLRADLESAQ